VPSKSHSLFPSSVPLCALWPFLDSLLPLRDSLTDSLTPRVFVCMHRTRVCGCECVPAWSSLVTCFHAFMDLWETKLRAGG
jgi:hypothetical protein